MTSGDGGPQKQEPSGFFRTQKSFIDRIKEDGIRKELYEKERRAQENWNIKWGFLKNPRKLWEEEAAKRGLPPGFFNSKNSDMKSPASPKSQKPKIQMLSSEKFPLLSSGLIGWRSTQSENNIDRMTGPMFISPKATMNPPSNIDDLDMCHQKFIFLG